MRGKALPPLPSEGRGLGGLGCSKTPPPAPPRSGEGRKTTMPTPEPLIRLLHAAYAAPADGVTDAELLARVAAGRADAAFELLVRRYAELVWRVCRVVTRDHHAAEDAFQAAFLALATKAAAVRGELGGWL